ncbi:MAG: ATP-dependent Clp protease adapter ClpS [Chloroflexota bacterium]|nr:ATP-dependent Clp protease adapter ClpS [Chloroflexota bacterium]
MAIKAISPVLETDTKTIPDIDKDTLRKLCPPYKVILHNDDHNPMDLVVLALVKSVPSLSENDAVDIMYTAHSEGSAIVITCPQEAAEFYQERIMSFGLTCTIEPDE